MSQRDPGIVGRVVKLSKPKTESYDLADPAQMDEVFKDDLNSPGRNFSNGS
ncbi:hypothetical protein X896_6249 [Burkholderia pseudomallei ABCPW 1]|nr:hypothetical protein X980_6013 [Burkholderia pseudomallei MSHR4000]KGW80503.1 hypothetical protein Y048_6004 [Burkholderia pseudomallei MSHR456]KGX23848.1 hypothetical protein X896_6249 [Burkholderia pseudomallei ABCPW 1]